MASMHSTSMPVAHFSSEADNSAVRINAAFLSMLMIALCASLAGTAQNWDRDTSSIPATSEKAPPPEARLDINHANMDELLKLPDMTRVWAARIVRYRPYRTKADLLEQGIITAKVYAHIKDYVIAHRDK